MRSRAARYLQISRPKFWLYLVGPYFLGGVLAAPSARALLEWQFLALLAWFTFPANLILYGVNDVCDYDTDRLNPKKATDEALVQPSEHAGLLRTILVLIALVVPCLFATNQRVVIAVILFLTLSVAYSVPPFRLKGRPVLDSLSNVLYLTPLLAAWWYFSPQPPEPALLLAGVLWCAAMHAYSAVPDIQADERAGVSTIATLLGRDGTLLACLLAYLGAAVLVLLHDLAAGLILSVYPLLMSAQLLGARESVRSWYRLFPLLNGLAGMGLTLRFLWPLAR